MAGRKPKQVLEPLPPDLALVDNWERSDPRAIINLVPPSVQNAILASEKSHPHLFGIGEDELFLKLKHSNRTPRAGDNALRLSFWQEYNAAQAESRNLNMKRVCSGVCTDVFLYQNYIKIPDKVAWLMCPPMSYSSMLEESVNYGLSLLRSFLAIDATKEGKHKMKMMELQVKIIAMMDQRLKGSFLQRTENKSLSVNLHTSSTDGMKEITKMSMAEIQARLSQLNRNENNLITVESDAAATVKTE